VGAEGQGLCTVVEADLGDGLVDEGESALSSQGVGDRRALAAAMVDVTVVVSQPVASTGTAASRQPVRRNDSAVLGYVGFSIITRSPVRRKARAAMAMPATAPLVTRISSGLVGRPRSVYLAAIRSRSSGTPRVK
jgi:hypothetical protein